MESDTIKTSDGDLIIHFLGHASLMMAYGAKILHIDPVTAQSNYAILPKADLILITHEHSDHFDPKAVNAIKTPATRIISTAYVAAKMAGTLIMKNGDSRTVDGLKIEAVPAYNLKHMRGPGVPFHPKDNGNGYVITFGDTRVYVASDTENTPEMKRLQNIDIAFLPMNLPYTMTPEMVADAACAFRPKILYPYHYGETDTSRLIHLLQDEKGIDVRIRQMK